MSPPDLTLSHGLASRPGSRPETPGIILEGREGLGGLEFDFAISLDIALLHVQKREVEEGKEATFKRRSDEDVWKNAWSTPTWCFWTANDSYVSTVSTTPTLSEPEQEQDLTFSPPRAWTLIRNKMDIIDTPPSAISETPGRHSLFEDDTSSPIHNDERSEICGLTQNPDDCSHDYAMSTNELGSRSLQRDHTNAMHTPFSPESESYTQNHSSKMKRKVEDYEDKENWIYPIKRNRNDEYTYSQESTRKELTPPSTPPSRDPQHPMNAMSDHKNLAQVVRQQSRRIITSMRHDSMKTHLSTRHSRRLRSLPP